MKKKRENNKNNSSSIIDRKIGKKITDSKNLMNLER